MRPARPALLTLLAAAAAAPAQIHTSPMAGRWFPADPAALQNSLTRAWTAATERAGVAVPREGLVGLIAPHAGLDYSGIVAAGAYRLIGKPRNIILLAFSHRRALEGVAAVDLESFRVPNATVRVARDVVRALGFPTVDEGSICDHSLENQLPLLARAAPQSPVIPLYVGRLSPAALAATASKLAARVRQGDLLIASSDFTHYGEAYGYTPFPNDARLPARLRQRAEDAFETIGSLDTAAFDRFLESTGDTICGRDPIRLLMATLAIAQPDAYMTTADYMTSADVSPSPGLSVGYGALAFYPKSAFAVSQADRDLLLRCSRATVDALAAGTAPPAVDAASPALAQRTGVFVTIRTQGRLRGCIGVLAPRTPLPETVADRTRAAARSDPRFPPLTRAEFPVSLEVSLLTPLKRLHDWRRFRLGQGGVLFLGERGGLLLPQVATEMKWTRDQFLAGLAEKAGLPGGAWRDPKAKLYVFDAQAFGE